MPSGRRVCFLNWLSEDHTLRLACLWDIGCCRRCAIPKAWRRPGEAVHLVAGAVARARSWVHDELAQPLQLLHIAPLGFHLASGGKRGSTSMSQALQSALHLRQYLTKALQLCTCCPVKHQWTRSRAQSGNNVGVDPLAAHIVRGILLRRPVHAEHMHRNVVRRAQQRRLDACEPSAAICPRRRGMSRRQTRTRLSG